MKDAQTSEMRPPTPDSGGARENTEGICVSIKSDGFALPPPAPPELGAAGQAAPRLSRRTLLTGLAAFTLPHLAFAEGVQKTAPDAPSFPVGKGGFAYVEPEGSPYAGFRIPVHTYRPEGVNLHKAGRVLFVMHGTLRNGAEYRDKWIRLAEQYNALLMVPEFTRRDFPGGMYNRGNVRGQDDKTPVPAEGWTFAVIERLFGFYKAVTGNPVAGYHIYGHSAGGQFVHRLVEFLPTARIVRAVAANAGYYTLPMKTEDPYPFSYTGTPEESEATRRAIFAQPLTVLLGEADTDPNDPDLYHSPEADKQGTTRFDRGKYFYAMARRTAGQDDMPLKWRMTTVPGVGHSNEKMAPAAARALFE
ncbi:MAG: alpha/beta hydrolase [Akkermansiaceae bacterium]|nr:alpha/beta hydrolase [Armatimonadota bacterium]